MDLTDVIGRFGPWQRRIFYVLLYRAAMSSLVLHSVLFQAFQTEHWCARDDPNNVTVEEWRSCCVPKDSHCEKIDFSSDSNSTVKCNSFEFESNDYAENMRQEWSLVCDRSWLVSVSYTALTIGNFLSYIPAGHISDKYGRRNISIISIILLTVIGVVGYFSPNIEFFIVLRVLSGLTYGFFQNSTICLFIEAVGPEYRTLMAASFLGTWGVGMMILPGLALLANDWRTLQLIIYLPFCAIAPVLLWKLVPESPRWLLSVGKYGEAEKIILNAAKINGKEITDSEAVMKALISNIEKEEKETSKHKRATFFDLFRTSRIRRMTLILYVSLFLTVFIYYGFSLSIGNLGGSLYVNVAIMGLTEGLSTGVFLLMAKYLTRRRSLLILFIASGLSFFITIAIPDELLWLRITIAMIGKNLNSIAYGFLWLMGAEIFPTNLRTVGVSGGMCAGRVGSMIGTFMDELGRVAGKNTPIGIYGALAVVTSVLFMLLPETRDKHLPDTITQSERLPETVESRK